MTLVRENSVLTSLRISLKGTSDFTWSSLGVLLIHGDTAG